MTGNKEKLPKLLQELVVTILSTVKEGLAEKILQPQDERYFRWKLTEYEYGDAGIIKKSAQGENLLKPDWFRAARTVSESVSKQSSYNELLKVISEGYGGDEVQYGSYLERLITKIAWNILESKDKTPTDLSKYAISLLKDLNKEAQEYRSEVQLRGLILQPDSIQLDDSARLRKPERKDFEREAPMFSFLSFGVMRLGDPTAFLHVRVSTTQGVRALQNEIEREIAMLRLFRVGAVQDLQYDIDSDSVIDFAGGTLSSGKVVGSDKYLITNEDVKPLKKFWANMKTIKLPILLAGTGEQKEPDELTIAYDRYVDSLEANMLEKRVSSAVMGLEALYLGGGEQQEMGYRLRMRVSRLLSLIGFDPNKTSESIKDAYEIRSKYVHGGLLNRNDRQKIEKKHGNINEFPKIIMDYLRASIVVLLKRPSKTSLIQKIDNSFLDSSKEEEIEKLLFTPY